MAISHDRASGPLAPPSISAGGRGADPLSDALSAVKLTGALFFLIEATDPWGVDVPPTERFARSILPGAQHVISYDVVLEGKGWVSIPGEEPIGFGAGDVLVFAHSVPHQLLSAPGQTPEFDAEATMAFLREMAAGRLPFATREGGGGAERTRYVCGYLGCDIRPFNPLLEALPPFLRVRRPPEAAPDLLDRLIELTLAEVATDRFGGESIRLRLSELVFLEALRRYLESLPAAATGWLAGLRDPHVGRALRLLHARPAEDWTLQALAREAAVSRAVLAARFAQLVGCPPMQYLTRWRMQCAARLLADRDLKVAAVAEAVGYASEAAFSRAFKRETGGPPAAWRRRQHLSDPGRPPPPAAAT